MEAYISRCLTGFDLEGGDQEALAETIASYFDDNQEALEGKVSTGLPRTLSNEIHKCREFPY